MPIPEAAEFIRQIDDPLARDIKTEILKRMNALIEIGLSYLSLSRGTDTLSGGEAQRIKIARYINSPLTDMMYVLDEPSVGLHSRDIQNLKNSLIKLKEHGNTVMIVEHHREVIALADHIVDMGPEAGINGGQIMYQGSYENLLKADTVTGRMLRTKTPMKMEYRKPTGWYQVHVTKDGYEEARSAWLRVPPIQTEVNIGLVSTAAPEVASAHAYTDCIEVEFTQYMDASDDALVALCAQASAT